MSSRHAEEEEKRREPAAKPAPHTSVVWLRSEEEQKLEVPALCWPFPPASQNQTDKAVKLKPYSPPKRRSLNQF